MSAVSKAKNGGGFSALFKVSATPTPAMDDFDTVIINVGGTRFETARSTLGRHPDTRLALLDENSLEYGPKKREFYFDRDPGLFVHILNFYRFGDLHFPRDLCGPTIRRELDFWGVDMQHVAPCCWGFFQACFDNDVTLKLLRQAFDTPDKPQQGESGASKWKTSKSQINRFLEDPSSSAWAKIYSWIFGAILVLAIFVILFSNLDVARVPAKFPRNVINSSTNLKLQRFEKTDPHPALLAVDIIILIFFTCEFILRIFVTPDRRQFFKRFSNIIELLAIIPKWTVLAIGFIPHYDRYPVLYWTYCYLSISDTFRVMRALKFGRNYVGLKVLFVTLRASATEMFFLLFLMMVGAVVFGVSVYFCEIWHEETFSNMPDGTYWAIITMTTVGYGDMAPKTAQGRVIAVLCALIGVLFTGLSVPIIANSFDQYYSMARLLLMRQRMGFSLDSVKKAAFANTQILIKKKQQQKRDAAKVMPVLARWKSKIQSTPDQTI